MNLLITGLPGVGKGTQSENIEATYKAKHLSTGDLFRNEIKSESELGLELADYINKGLLVPDELTIKILEAELSKVEYNSGFLLDGFPRTVDQAKFLDQMLEEKNISIDAVIALDLDEQIITSRLVNRRICSKCGASYHLLYVKPKLDGFCDNCNGELIHRADDTVESIQKRLDVAKEQTLPVVEYYKKQNKVLPILIKDSDSKDDVFDLIKASLND